MRFLFVLPLLAAVPLCGFDEGIWLVDQFPKQLVEQKYHFKVTQDFLDHLRASSVRFNNGGSGSFVSPHGLLFTNHHVGLDCIQKLSTPEHDTVALGFAAPEQKDEKVCPDLEVNVLLRIEDVTAKVNAAAPPSANPAEAGRLRRAAMTALEKQCGQRSGNRCDVVTLFAGGQYGLYEYKKYTDIRLVFAPEASVAAFGGDPDNFTYPRYCLDFAFFRAYENGNPVDSKDFLKWSKRGAADKELTFVAGNPGNTGRLMTVAQLEFERDVTIPVTQPLRQEMIRALLDFEKRDAESRRVVQDDLEIYQNSYKAFSGFLRGLQDEKLMDRKREEERRLRSAIADDPAKQAKYGPIWDEIKQVMDRRRGKFVQGQAVDRPFVDSDLLRLGREALRYAEEKTKPDDQRLREFSTPALPAVEQSLYSTAPLTDSLQVVKLTVALRNLNRLLGDGNPLVQQVLAGKSPAQAAAAMVANTEVKKVEFRKMIANDVEKARTTEDPIMRVVRLLDGPSRAYRKDYEDNDEPILRQAASKIAQARYAVYGANEYPDATFTFRISYGDVRGYKNDSGAEIPWATDFDGLYKHATGVDPFALPDRWLKAKGKLKLTTPFNFVTTADTHGGNSGSPTVNTRGELVGILFDGNLEGLPNRYVYTDDKARSIHVASQGIVEALRNVYGAHWLVKELGL
ncbi:MAG TPA: S46 family peptidase [Bryobacteraceae bacterium]|jgi:hypothetical protein